MWPWQDAKWLAYMLGAGRTLSIVDMCSSGQLISAPVLLIIEEVTLLHTALMETGQWMWTACVLKGEAVSDLPQQSFDLGGHASSDPLLHSSWLFPAHSAKTQL